MHNHTRCEKRGRGKKYPLGCERTYVRTSVRTYIRAYVLEHKSTRVPVRTSPPPPPLPLPTNLKTKIKGGGKEIEKPTIYCLMRMIDDYDVYIHEYIMVGGSGGMDICRIDRGVVVLCFNILRRREMRERRMRYILYADESVGEEK